MRRCLVTAFSVFAVTLSSIAQAEVLIGVAGPMTGKEAWPGEQMQRGAELAATDLNASGGILGEQIRLVAADDFCDPQQAVAAAQSLVSQGVVLVVGHYCSGASVPASEVYEAAGVLQISPASSNPILTELGRANVFRVVNRDDVDGTIAGNYLVDHWADARVAVIHDGTTFGKGVADLTKSQLNKRGVTEAVYEAFVPGKDDYTVEMAKLQAADIAAVFIGGYHTEIALLVRAAYDRGYSVQVIAGNVLGTEEFGLIAGPAAEGTLFVSGVEPRKNAAAAIVVERFRGLGFEPEGYTLFAYGAVQVWAQAAAKSGSLELEAMIASLRENHFDTVLGPLDFDDKGDLTVQSSMMYVWRGGAHMPLQE
jgi:branched-chain amino acid transport system substrate-binding protein